MAESTPQERLRSVISGLRVLAEEAKESFAEGFPRAAAAADPLATASAPGAFASPRGDAPQEALRSIRQDIGDCRRCKLASGRTHIVFGVGNPDAAVMFVGEGPGEDEDRKGEPFVGRAGQLLTEIITNGMGLRRSDVYIANVVKCRPPGNRNPEPDEIAACKPFLLSQIDAVAPKVVVALGKFAAHTLLDTTLPISKLRGRWFDFRGTRLMPTFHPSYLLRTPSEKKLAWEDIKLVMQALDLPLPKTAKPRA
jgi:uracil-DNA glycosylase family 4